jgi:hypothetical protein
VRHDFRALRPPRYIVRTFCSWRPSSKWTGAWCILHSTGRGASSYFWIQPWKRR